MPKVKPLMYTPEKECRDISISIKTLMLRNGIMQQDLAKKLHISAATMSTWLSNPSRMRLGDLCEIANELGVNKLELMREVL